MGPRSSLFLLIVLLLISLFSFECKSQQRRPLFACGTAPTRKLPFCNVSLPLSSRVIDLIGRLSLQEKIKWLVNNAAPLERLNISRYEWWSEALHGVADSPGVKFGGRIPGATSFPQVITTAASFNGSLWEAIGQAVSDEARAMYNEGIAGLTYWSPNVNIFRDPRWGRGQETPGEDPFLASWYAISYVKGLQGNVDDSLKVAACCKHFTAYDLDNWNGVNRFHFNAKVTKQDLDDTYNVPFQACVLYGKVASIMCSYNQVNGIPTCADPIFLRGTIRDQWHLNGYIVSDCDSVEVLYKDQHFTATPEDAAAITIKAGLDLDCGPYLAVYTEKAINDGKLSEGDVNRSLTYLLTVQMRLGLFDGLNQNYLNLGPKDVCTAAHKKLALEAAQQGIVLLQNNKKALPLSINRKHTVAVIGPHSNATVAMIGNYAGIPCNYITPLQGISRYAKIVNEIGCTNVACADNKLFGRAESAARGADATILMMGLNQDIEREGLDRVNLLLPGRQPELITRVAKVAKGPVIIVLVSGGPIDITFAINDPKVTAILWVGYPGQAGGAAIADVLFGTINPGGRLPMTWYPQDYLAKVPMTNMNMRSNQSSNYPGRTYRFYNGRTVYSFGYGLSYTSFKHTFANGPTKFLVPFKGSKSFNTITTTSRLSKAIRVSHASCEALNFTVHINVENIGEIDGTQTVMVFASTSKKFEEKKLVAFKKIHMVAREKKPVEINLSPCDHLSIVDKFGIRRLPLGVHNLHFGENLKHTITLYNDAIEEIMP